LNLGFDSGNQAQIADALPQKLSCNLNIDLETFSQF